MNAIIELQKDLTDPSSKLSDILPKAYLIVQKLKLDELSQWITNEMKGYSNVKECPDYRHMNGVLKGWNPYIGWQVIQIPNVELENVVNNFVETESIRTLESLIETKEVLYHTVPAELIDVLHLNGCTQLGIYFMTTSYRSVIEAVRQELLDWTITLEKNGIKGENMSFLKEEVKKAQNTTPATIINNFSGDINALQMAQNNETVNQSQDNKKSGGLLSAIWSGIKKLFSW